MDKKNWIVVGVVVVVVLIAGFVISKTLGGESQGETQSNVADFAKSIDHTKADTPSVSPEQLSLGRSGPTKGRGGR